MNRVVIVWWIISIWVIGAFATPLQKHSGIIEGKLQNGMSYTIMRNSKPKDIVELRLLVKAGSLDEEEDQRGLAHFVEHMAFNGTKHFAKNSLISYLESTGVKFGTHLNASTSYEKTIYKLSVPTKGDWLEKSFTILQDWATGLNFDPKEFEKERGVVLEEMRLGDNVVRRLFKKYKNLFFTDSTYMDRDPIGLKNVIKNASVTRARDFYTKWYRPELMHIVVVGDFNTTQVEQTLYKKFAYLTNDNSTPTIKREIPDHNDTRVLSITDKEVTSNTLRVYYTDTLDSLTTIEDKRQAIVELMVVNLFNAKAKEQILKPNPKAMLISMSSSPISKSKAVYSFTTTYKERNDLEALYELYQLIYSYEQYGFSRESLAVAKRQMSISNDNIYKAVIDMKSSAIASRLLSSAQSHSVYIDYEYDHNLTKSIIDSITIDEINEQLQKILHLSNRAMLFINTTGKKVTKADVDIVLSKAKVDTQDLSVEQRLPTTLMDTNLTKGRIVSKEYNATTGVYSYTLSSGATVEFKPTKYSNNSLFLSGYSKGGYSLVSSGDLYNAKKASTIIAKSGIGKYSNSDIQKILSGKNVTVSTGISRFGETITAKCGSKDIKEMFELLYMKLSSPKIDKIVSENEINILKSRVRKLNRKPAYRFGTELAKYYYHNNPRVIFDTLPNIETLDNSKMLEIYKDRFADINNFHFVIVGDSKTRIVEELIAIYIANMPYSDRNESFIERDYSYLRGKKEFIRKYNNDNIANITLTYKSGYIYNPKNKATLDAMASILKVRLRELIREKKSGVYGISVSDSVIRELRDKTTVQISFSCDPKRAEELIKSVKSELIKYKLEGPTVDELASFKKKFTVDYKASLVENNFWMYGIMNAYKYNLPSDTLLQIDDIIDGITLADINRTANSTLGDDELLTELLPKK